MILSSSGWLYTCTTSEWTLRNLRNSLDCDGHAWFPDCNPWFKETPTRSVGTIYLCSQRTTPNIGANVWAIFPINCENNIHQTLKPSTSSFHVPFTTESHPSRGVPSPNPPPRPRPSSPCASTAAFASRSRSATASWPLAAALCSGVLPREPANPRRKPQGRTQTERRGEKYLRKLWAPQKSKSWKIVATQSPPSI